MKRAIPFFAALLLTFVSVSPSFASVLNNGDNNEDQEINIRISDKIIVTGHRAPARI